MLGGELHPINTECTFFWCPWSSYKNNNIWHTGYTHRHTHPKQKIFHVLFKIELFLGFFFCPTNKILSSTVMEFVLSPCLPLGLSCWARRRESILMCLCHRKEARAVRSCGRNLRWDVFLSASTGTGCVCLCAVFPTYGVVYSKAFHDCAFTIFCLSENSYLSFKTSVKCSLPCDAFLPPCLHSDSDLFLKVLKVILVVAWTGMVVMVNKSGQNSDVFWRLSQLALLRDRIWIWKCWQNCAVLLKNGIHGAGDFMKYPCVYLLKNKSPDLGYDLWL